ncbi:hypothetical protein AGMMS49975_08760 [Clostridia bacterium]|nr:hypothetical protein AGMMS49975_08760 [Clostridia bacterium]
MGGKIFKTQGRALEEIPIVYTGVRPGEKLYEELILEDEKLTKTDNMFITKPIPIDDDIFTAQLKELGRAAKHSDKSRVMTILHKIVPNYTSE